MPRHTDLVVRIEEAYADLTIETIRWIDAGQFNLVAIVNSEIVFRFPRYAEQARRLARQAHLLSQIRPHLNLPIPDPI